MATIASEFAQYAGAGNERYETTLRDSRNPDDTLQRSVLRAGPRGAADRDAVARIRCPLAGAARGIDGSAARACAGFPAPRQTTPSRRALNGFRKCRCPGSPTSAIRKRYFARPAGKSSRSGACKAILRHPDRSECRYADVDPAPAYLVYRWRSGFLAVPDIDASGPAGELPGTDALTKWAMVPVS
jgi:hypothetical protein